MKLKQLILSRYPNFFSELDANFRMFAREIKKELRDEGHVIIGITGFPNTGKSNMASILGILVDDDYDFDLSVCYIPTAKEIEDMYFKFKPYSYFHIDEASRAMHKHKWYERVQQKINELYDVEREGHFLCTVMIMPRFQNFTENFRNFMIKYWINCPIKGLAVFYKRDEDKDCKDPWHIEENYKKKRGRFKGKRVFERTLPDQITAEQITDCYWFYCKVPAIPEDIWRLYQELKKQSRFKSKSEISETESYPDRRERERKELWEAIKKLKDENKPHIEIAAILNLTPETIRKHMRMMEATGYIQKKSIVTTENTNNIIYNHIEIDKLNETKMDKNKVPNVKQKNGAVE